MMVSRSTSALAMSIVMTSLSMGAPSGQVKAALSKSTMTEVFAGRVLVKLRGADQLDGRPARPSPAQQNRIARKLLGGRMVSGLKHGGWTIWQIASKQDP